LYGEGGTRRVSLNVLGFGAASIYQHYPDGKMLSFGWVPPGGDGKGMPNLAFRGPDGEVYAILMGRTDSASPSFEVFSREPGRSGLLEKLGGARP